MGAERAKGMKSEAKAWPVFARAERYDDAVNRAFYRAAVARLLEKAPRLTGRGLDLGCGTGFSLEELAVRAPDVAWIGADCSRRMLELARSKPELRAALLCEAKAEALPFADRSFDVVVANFSWHWFGAEAGHQVRRVLRPDGWFLATLPLRRFSAALGNRALARALLANRGYFVRRSSQGFRFEDVPRVLPGGLKVSRHELVVASERFANSRELLDVLRSRGALAAIFGDVPPTDIEAPSPVDFEWPFAVLHAQVLDKPRGPGDAG
jgi:ubiquinone/menaquinone biosynthesis C-methylase UbiE